MARGYLLQNMSTVLKYVAQPTDGGVVWGGRSIRTNKNTNSAYFLFILPVGHKAAAVNGFGSLNSYL